MGKAVGRKLARKFTLLHKQPLRKRRMLRAIERRLNGDGRATLRRALRRDIRDGKLAPADTHLAKFLKARGM